MDALHRARNGSRSKGVPRGWGAPAASDSSLSKLVSLAYPRMRTFSTGSPKVGSAGIGVGAAIAGYEQALANGADSQG
jgi:hypothetical protein